MVGILCHDRAFSRTPLFDSRLYSDLNQNEISSYQKKLVESIRNNRINGILAGVPVLPTDKFDSARPVIMTPKKEIFGALGEERIHIAQFAQESSNFAQPQRKTFKDIQIAGPFKVYIGDSDQASELFFVSRANGQQEILRYMLDHPLDLAALNVNYHDSFALVVHSYHRQTDYQFAKKPLIAWLWGTSKLIMS